MGISYHTAFTYLSLTPIAIFKPDPYRPTAAPVHLSVTTSNLQRDRDAPTYEPACQPGCAALTGSPATPAHKAAPWTPQNLYGSAHLHLRFLRTRQGHAERPMPPGSAVDLPGLQHLLLPPFQVASATSPHPPRVVPPPAVSSAVLLSPQVRRRPEHYADVRYHHFRMEMRAPRRGVDYTKAKATAQSRGRRCSPRSPEPPSGPGSPSGA